MNESIRHVVAVSAYFLYMRYHGMLNFAQKMHAYFKEPMHHTMACAEDEEANQLAHSCRLVASVGLIR